MVRQGRILIVALALASRAFGQPAEVKPVAEAIDRKPYKIEVHFGVDPEARIDARGRAELIAAWKALIAQFVGAPWELTIAEAGSALSNRLPDSLDNTAFAKAGDEFDKVWVVHVGREGAGYLLTGREFDTTTKRLGPVHRRSVPFVPDAPRGLLELALEVFAPLAEVGAQSGGGVALTVRGGALIAASPQGRVVLVGAVFQPLRRVTPRTGEPRVLGIPFSYLQVESLDGAVAHCTIVSALRDPLTRRMAQKSTFLALGLKAAKAPTRLRFVNRPDQTPAAGYMLTARTLPNGRPEEVGTTDRGGRIVLPAGLADGLVILRLLAGNIEPMVELPLMPGESEAERTIPIEPKPLTVALETRLDSLRDTVIDLVAVRARLEARLKARYDAEEWEAVKTTLKEFDQLPTRDTIANDLTKLKDDAIRQQAKTKTAVLTKTAQTQLAEIEGMINRYLDDDIFKGYAESLDKMKTDAAKPAPAKKAG